MEKDMFILIFLLFSVILFAVSIEQVEASNTIYIRADGSIDPATANITTSDYVTYTFTDNNYDSIVVERNSIIIDGSGYAVESLLGNDTIGINLHNRNNVTLKNVTITNFTVGIYLTNSNNNIIEESNLTNNREDGIYLEWCWDNAITGNSIANNDVGGIYLGWSSNNAITGNSIVNNGWEGIYFEWSSNNAITGNSIANNGWEGIYLGLSSDNIITSNNIINNGNDGIHLRESSYNTLFHNSFIDNVVQITNSTNSWDDGYPSGGNYWSNYAGDDLNHDGIGDIQHGLGEYNSDYHPLMGVFSSFNTSLGEGVNVVSNSTLENLQYSEETRTITLYTSNTTGNQTQGFCRVCIPHSVINATEGPIAVIINEGVTPVLNLNNTLHDNGTHRWIYFAYEHSPLEIVIIPEYSSLILLSLFMIITLTATLLYKRKRSIRHLS